MPENHLTGPLDESEYQLWANRYCSKQEAEIKDIPPPEGPRGHVRWAEKALERTELNARRRNMLDAPGDLQSLHDRASDLARQDTAETQRLIETKAPGDAKTAAQRLRRIRKQTPLTRELVYIYIQLELDQCVRLYTPVEEPGSRRPPVVEKPPGENIRPEPGLAAVCRDLAADIREERDEQRSWADEARDSRELVGEIEREVRAYPENRAKIEPDLNDAKRTLKEEEDELSNVEDTLDILATEARDQGCPR